MTSIAELYALQEFDLDLSADRDALADVLSRLGESEGLIEARAKVSERQEALHEAEVQFKERESEADALRSKIEPVEGKLYRGSVQNPKELEDLQQDLESLKRRRSELEDRALEAMDVQEQAQQALDEAQQELQALGEAHLAEQDELRGRQTALEAQIAALESRRAEQASRIDPATLRLYDQLSASRGGRAVAKVEGGACQGCRISLPVNVLQRARSGADMVRCSNCDRILYVS